MSMVDWYVEGVEFGSCNCDYGCLVSSNRARPTATAAASRSCGSTSGTFRRGSARRAARCPALCLARRDLRGQRRDAGDQRANPAQRQASPPSSMAERRRMRRPTRCLHAMSSTVHEPIFKPIEFEVDIEKRRARVVIPGVLSNPAAGRSAAPPPATSTACASTSRTASSSRWPRSAAPRPRRPGDRARSGRHLRPVQRAPPCGHRRGQRPRLISLRPAVDAVGGRMSPIDRLPNFADIEAAASGCAVSPCARRLESETLNQRAGGASC